MRQFIGKVIAFFALLALGHVAVVCLVANSSPRIQAAFRRHTNIPVVDVLRGRSSLVRFRDIESRRDIDVLFLGSSHCYRGFDTRHFTAEGFSSFNMGSTAQTPLNGYYLLRRYLPALKPKLLVVEVYWDTLANDGLESFLDLCANLPMKADLWEMAAATRNLRAINAMLSRSLDFDAQPMSEISPAMDSVDTYVSGGFVARDLGYRSPGKVSSRAAQMKRNRKPSATQLEHLDLILALARGAGTRVVFVLQPVTEARRRRIMNLAEVVQAIRSFSTKRTVPFIDMGEHVSLDDDKHFYDEHHLNQRGVDRCNARLIQLLNARGLLPKPKPSTGR